MLDLNQLFGLGSLTLVRAIVKELKPTKAIWAVLEALVVGVVFNVALAIVLKGDIYFGIAIGVVVGLLANFYNDGLEVLKK